jgi:hypothetical protein
MQLLREDHEVVCLSLGAAKAPSQGSALIPIVEGITLLLHSAVNLSCDTACTCRTITTVVGVDQAMYDST